MCEKAQEKHIRITFISFFYLFLEREEGREKERERDIIVWLSPSSTHAWGPGLQPRRVS